MKIDNEDKYEIVLNFDEQDFYAKRYGEYWLDLMGNNLILAMYYRIEYLTELLDNVINENDLQNSIRDEVITITIAPPKIEDIICIDDKNIRLSKAMMIGEVNNE